MEKFEFNGETYIYNNGKFLDEYYSEISLNKLHQVADFYFANRDYTIMNIYQIFDYIKELKNLNLNIQSIKTIEYAIDKYSEDVNFVRKCLPILTSSYRAINQPEKAITVAKKYIKSFEYTSTPLLTSLAAACCDMEDYDSAKKYANAAYAKQCGSTGDTTELTLVYKRIKKFTEENK